LVAWPLAAFGMVATPATSASSALRDLGFAVIPHASVAQELVRECRVVCSSRLERLLDAADDAGCDVLEQQYSFNEICHRKRLRWDVRMPTECKAWQQLTAQAFELAQPVLRELCADGCEPRVVISRPGAGPQSFHADGGGGLYNIFIPLVDVAPEKDGTQFWPASHLDARAPDRAYELEGDAEAMGAMVSPGCAAGGLLCFDYRIVHRGLSSIGRERAVAYVVAATTADSADTSNFPAMSVAQALPVHTESMPYWTDEVGRVRLVQQQRRDSLLRRIEQGMSPDGYDAPPLARAKECVRAYCGARGLDPRLMTDQLGAAQRLLMCGPYTPDVDGVDGAVDSVAVRIRTSAGRGLGAFATQAFAAHDVLGEYTGELLTSRQRAARYGSADDARLATEVEAWAVSRRKRGVTTTGDYVLQVSADLYLDAEDVVVASWTRYVNYSPAPNVGVKAEPQESGGSLRVWFVALRAISVGEELKVGGDTPFERPL